MKREKRRDEARGEGEWEGEGRRGRSKREGQLKREKKRKRGERQEPGERMREKRRKEKFRVLQWADSLLRCRDAAANKNHTHACTNTHTHTCMCQITIWHTCRQVHPRTPIPSTQNAHTQTQARDCRSMSSTRHRASFGLQHTSRGNDIQWACYWENTPPLTTSLSLSLSRRPSLCLDLSFSDTSASARRFHRVLMHSMCMLWVSVVYYLMILFEIKCCNQVFSK